MKAYVYYQSFKGEDPIVVVSSTPLSSNEFFVFALKEIVDVEISDYKKIDAVEAVNSELNMLNAVIDQSVEEKRVRVRKALELNTKQLNKLIV